MILMKMLFMIYYLNKKKRKMGMGRGRVATTKAEIFWIITYLLMYSMEQSPS